MDLFENIVDIIITDLFNEKEENKHFWSCVFKDDDHPFFIYFIITLKMKY